jgi:hypothetical protein
MPSPRSASTSALRAVADIIAAKVSNVDCGEDFLAFHSSAGPTRVQRKALDLPTVESDTVSDVFLIETQLREELSAFFDDRRLVTINTMAALGAMIRGPRSSALNVVSRLSVYQNDDAWRLYTRLVALAALLQGDALLAAVGAALGYDVPKLDLPDRENPSRWSGTDFGVAKERLIRLGLLATAGPSGLSVEVPVRGGEISGIVGDDTGLLTFHADMPHPALGAGLLYKLELPMRFEEEALINVANELNRVEVDAVHSPPFFGAWCSQITSGRLAYVGFWPNLLYAPETVLNISSWMVARQRQSLEIIGRIRALHSWQTLHLDYGISLEAPTGWRNDHQDRLESPYKPVVDLRAVEVDSGGHLITLAPPFQSDGEASIGFEILSSRVGQRDMVRLTDAEIREAELREFLPEVERALSNTGSRLTRWHHTMRATIGGRHGLVNRYEYTDRDGRQMSKTTYSVYLGSRAIHVHEFRREPLATSIATTLDRMITSIRIAVESL